MSTGCSPRIELTTYSILANPIHGEQPAIDLDYDTAWCSVESSALQMRRGRYAACWEAVLLPLMLPDGVLFSLPQDERQASVDATSGTGLERPLRFRDEHIARFDFCRP